MTDGLLAGNNFHIISFREQQKLLLMFVFLLVFTYNGVSIVDPSESVSTLVFSRKYKSLTTSLEEL